MYVYASHAWSTHGGWERMPDPLGLELRMIVSCCVGAGICLGCFSIAITNVNELGANSLRGLKFVAIMAENMRADR